MQPWSQPLLWPHPSGAVNDPYFGNVVLLMGYEGTNGSTGAPGMTDESPAAHGTATRNSTGSTISTAQFKFGTSSLSTTDTSSSIYFPDSNDWYFASSPFTIEMWIYPTGSLTGPEYLIGQYQVSLSWTFFIQTGSLNWATSTDGSTFNNDINSAGAVVLNTWQHVCIDFDGAKYRVYINGTMVGSFTTVRALFNSTSKLTISSYSTALNFDSFEGYIDELRITKGVARYASDAGFTVPTTAFPRS
jgi:hypothetical protein